MLVMAPKSAIFQWADSVRRFNVDLEPFVVGYDSKTGNPRARQKRYTTYSESKADVLLLSYHQMARDLDVILEEIENFIHCVR